MIHTGYDTCTVRSKSSLSYLLYKLHRLPVFFLDQNEEVQRVDLEILEFTNQFSIFPRRNFSWKNNVKTTIEQPQQDRTYSIYSTFNHSPLCYCRLFLGDAASLVEISRRKQGIAEEA